MIVRKATSDDIKFIVTEGIKFLRYHPAKIEKDLNIPHLFELADALITNHVMLVSVNESNDLTGMIGGAIIPNMFNPKYTVLQEVFWWVKEEYRTSSAAVKLFKAFEKKAVDLSVNVISMVTTSYTPTLEKYYKRSGYTPVESTFIKEL